MPRIASPAMPAAASIVVAMTIADWVTSEDPAVAVGATNGVQLSVPRSTSVSDVHCVVTPEDSMKSRNLGLILPKMSKATIHHVLASARQGIHHAVNRHHVRFGRCANHQMTATPQANAVATALTAPIKATATADNAAARRGDMRPWKVRMSGSSTHGASIMGKVSEEIAPRVVSTRGDSAKATAAMIREPRVPIPSASATRMRPQNPATMSSAHHSRCVTQAGTPSRWPSEKKAPWGNRYPYA
ncbi:Uncharacterised protein [Mycobacteroides abscessus]|nr:Uncharacterised protein [Mycobacteroides abscessus]CQA10762.1 Uncharacterised protein [Mycobacteroides abscessus]SIA25489.1 Uncharacterised protein [Mycobacteroides abscessus subsp. abscessus]SKY33979.1 Uncharacterised protein [Mycobacteroides abscessus subsp. abscessus]SKZ04559.1 Uncharacterised protein [Mycobacteroides abscessus subsp. abscessus]